MSGKTKESFKIFWKESKKAFWIFALLFSFSFHIGMGLYFGARVANTIDISLCSKTFISAVINYFPEDLKDGR